MAITTWHILREDGESVNPQPKPFIVGDETLHEWGWFPGCDSFWSI